MTLSTVKNFFPFNQLEAYHKDLGYGIPFESLEDLPTLIHESKITHFSTSLDGTTVTVYCEG